MIDDIRVGRRSVLLGAAGATALGLMGEAIPGLAETAPLRVPQPPLWRTAAQRGIVFGSSTATWQITDKHYRRLFDHEAAMLFTEDDLLWYRLKPKPTSNLRFHHSDHIISFAERNRQLVFGAHLVWDEGFGGGWTDDDLWGLNRKQATNLLYGTIHSEVARYRGRVTAWSVANEVTDPEGRHGIRTNVPWYHTIGPSYIHECFHIAHAEDPAATLVLNEFGFETVNRYGDKPSARRRATLKVLDRLLHHNVPVHALGIQGHLLAAGFENKFHAPSYRSFLSEVAARGLKILITEMDVMDSGLPADRAIRDRKIADVYRRYLDVTLDEPAVKAVLAFGLSDRYTWLQEDYPRPDGAQRRPLAFNQNLRPKPAYYAISESLGSAPKRHPLWGTRRTIWPKQAGN
jgi:endo-1,4-beta-xylanase